MTQERPVQEYRLSVMQSLQQQKSWRFEGRLSVVDERESISASINWRHGPDGEQIELAGPLAQGRVQVWVSSSEVVIDDGDKRQVYPGKAGQVIAEQLGIDMPVDAMRYWVLGVNDPAQSYVEQQDGFVQDGWSILYKEMQVVSRQWLPKKISAVKNKTRIKLIVDQWELS